MPDNSLSGIYGYEFFAKYMQSKILSKRAWLIVVPSGLILFVALLLHFIPKNSAQGSSALLVENVAAHSNQEEEYQEQEYQEQENIGLPARMKIPVLNVDTAIIPVGLAPDGAMDVPKDPAEVAWFNLGSRPGENGSAVIAGHYDWKKNLPAVFYNLHKLRIGDKITVEDEKGLVTTFVVRETRIYDKDAIAPEIFGSSDGKGHLNLITCTGSWNKAEKIYSERLVVFTDKE